MQVKVHTSQKEIPPGDELKLRQNGLDVKHNKDGGYDIVSTRQGIIPKTVTGFWDPEAGVFVAVVTDPHDPLKKRNQTIEFWRRE